VPAASVEMRFREPTPPENGAYPGFRPGTTYEDGLRIDRDVAVPMRDGEVVYADVYRPEQHTEPLAVLMCWGPYGKHGGPGRGLKFRPGVGIERDWISDHAAHEAPDPAYWCPRGYAVVYPDPRGTWNTPGDFTMGTREEALDYHDLVEWAGTQDWSSGKVGTTGVSYLAFSQWRMAATRPPHLAAINPWEGLNDFYREIGHHGGIPESRFPEFWITRPMGYGRGRFEDIVAMFAEHPLRDEYWLAKDPDLAQIDVPAYIVAGWGSQGLHLRGTLESYKQLAGERTWLEAHGRKIWRNYYLPSSVESQRQFFDWALKGEDSGWTERPRVLLSVRKTFDTDETRGEREWPPARTRFTKLHLDADSGQLVAEAPQREASVGYQADSPFEDADRAVFEHTFEDATELTGHMKLRLWLEIAAGDDADVFVAVQKLDADGELVSFPLLALREDGPVALGWLRASHRELDPERSTPEQPWHPHTSEDPLTPGEPVALEIEIWPSSTSFEAGESLRLVVQGCDVYAGPDSEFGHDVTRNSGVHTIHTGGAYDSHLLVPVIPT
jgi:predicted acyl esterase